MESFYEWVDDRATWISLTPIIAAAMLAAFTSVEFSMRVVWFLGGVYFFCLRPMASLKPRYRRVVGGFKVMFWDVPNTAELAFLRLRTQADETRERLIEEDTSKHLHGHMFEPDMPILAPATSASSSDTRTLTHANGTILERTSQPRSPSDSTSSSVTLTNHPLPAHTILSFRGRHTGIIGRLTLSLTHISFTSSLDTHILWIHPYSALIEMRKATSTGRIGKLAPTVVPNEGMSLFWADESKTIIEGLRKRDEAFNAILGFAGSRWMQLHPCDEGLQANGDETIEGRRGWRPWRSQKAD